MNRFLDMKNSFPALISPVIIPFILFGGCLQSSPAIPVPVPTPSNTNPPITPTANSPPACSLEPGPTQIIPAYEAVSVTVNHNTVTENPSIAVAFDGGVRAGNSHPDECNRDPIGLRQGTAKPGQSPHGRYCHADRNYPDLPSYRGHDDDLR